MSQLWPLLLFTEPKANRRLLPARAEAVGTAAWAESSAMPARCTAAQRRIGLTTTNRRGANVDKPYNPRVLSTARHQYSAGYAAPLPALPLEGGGFGWG
jgi:hypothetical protein